MSAAGEGPRLVQSYRRFLSEGTRHRIAQRISPERRQQVKQVLGDAAAVAHELDRVRLIGVGRRNSGLLVGSDRRMVKVDGRSRVAFIHDEPLPLVARAENRAAVAYALEGAGVEHFAVRGTSDVSAVIAVPRSQRARALRALAELCARIPGYVSLMTGDAAKTPLSCEPGFTAGHGAGVWSRLAKAPAVRLTWFHTDSQGRIVFGLPYGCDVEFWDEDGKSLVAPRRNRTSQVLPASGRSVECSDSRFTRLLPADGRAAGRVRTRPEFTEGSFDDIDFPVDVVYTWVDGNDPEWQRRRAQASGQAYHAEAANAARFISRDELKYSLRSIHMYAPWVRNIYLVTDDQVPSWLDTSVAGLRVVSHKEIFSDPSVLPTFNSHAIESQLHHIEGLAEHFLYFNDDMFLGREVVPQDFFQANGMSKFFLSAANVPPGRATNSDVPVTVAGKNVRALIAQRFGTNITQKMKHVPYALRRSVLAEIEQEFPEQHRVTMGNRFRSTSDISIASSLHHYYGFHTGKSIPGNVSYAYVDVSMADTAVKLDRLLRRRAEKAFCLNDSLSTESDAESQEQLLGPFLEAYFPIPSPYEKR